MVHEYKPIDLEDVLRNLAAQKEHLFPVSELETDVMIAVGMECFVFSFGCTGHRKDILEW